MTNFEALQDLHICFGRFIRGFCILMPIKTKNILVDVKLSGNKLILADSDCI